MKTIKTKRRKPVFRLCDGLPLWFEGRPEMPRVLRKVRVRGHVRWRVEDMKGGNQWGPLLAHEMRALLQRQYNAVYTLQPKRSDA